MDINVNFTPRQSNFIIDVCIAIDVQINNFTKNLRGFGNLGGLAPNYRYDFNPENPPIR